MGVDWNDLLAMLRAFGFAEAWTYLIFIAISSMKISVKINGSLACFFAPLEDFLEDFVKEILYLLSSLSFVRNHCHEVL